MIAGASGTALIAIDTVPPFCLVDRYHLRKAGNVKR